MTLDIQLKKIGIFGGSFDPPHNGHLIAAQAAAEQLNLDKVLLIPTANQPHKPDGAKASAAFRWKMVCAAVEGSNLFEPCRIELDRKGLSYTVDTIHTLRESYPSKDYELYCLIGLDSLSEIESWRDPEELFRLVNVAALARGSNHSRSQSEYQRKAIILDTPLIDISSTEIRNRIHCGLPIRWMVPEAVEGLIFENGLYRQDA